MKSLIVLATLLVSLVCGAIAQATTIDFSTLAIGTPVTNQFPGVSFSLSGAPGPVGAPAIGWGNGLSNTVSGDYPTAQYLRIDFAAPASDVSFTFNNFGGPNGSNYLAYDSASNVVQSGLIDYGAYTSSFTLVDIIPDDISAIVLDNATYGSRSWEFSIGTLEYTESAPIPEPGTMVLLSAGLLGLTIYGKRRKSSRQ